MELDLDLPQPGAVVASKYRIERVLGMGGMGVVYAAKHELLNQHVALKLLLPQVAKNKEAVARFLHEGRATARLQSAHVVRVMDVGVEGTSPFLAMELLSGEDLGQLLEARGRFLITETVDYLIEAIEGLSHAHAAGIIHRDLKPSNLFLARGEGEARTIKVVDFGISKSVGNDGAITATSAVLGSPAYMAPEQLRSSKHVDARVDVWSLGVIAFELLTGTMPFDGDTVGEIFANVLEKNPVRPGSLRVEIPGKLEEAILKCLQKSADARFSNVGELAAAIARHGTGRCDPLLASITKRFAGATAPMRSASIPDLELPVSKPKLPAPPISAPSVGGSFDFDEEIIAAPLLTTDEAAKRTVVAKPAAPAVTARRNKEPSALLPVLLHAGLVIATFVLLRRFAPVHRAWDLYALLPGTTEGASAKTTAIVGGIFGASAIACCIAAITSHSARWGLLLSTLGLLAITLGMFLVMGSATGGVIGVLSGEKVFVLVGAPLVATGVAIACLGKARDAWSDYARALPPLLAVVAGALVFSAFQLARTLL